MIKLFEVEADVVKPTEHCYILPFLRDIITLYPACYMKAFAYIFYMSCPDEDLNPLRDVKEIDRSEEAMRLLRVDPETEFVSDDKEIEDAVKECKKLYDDPLVRVFRSAKVMLEKLQESFDTEELVWGGKEATATALTNAMEKLPKLAQAYNDLDIKMKQMLKNRSRGGQFIPEDLDDKDE